MTVRVAEAAPSGTNLPSCVVVASAGRKDGGCPRLVVRPSRHGGPGERFGSDA